MQKVRQTVSLLTILSALNPLQLIKTRIQTNNQLVAQGRIQKPYKGIIDCFKTVNKVQGLRALWKGNMMFLIRFFPSQTLNFFMKNNFRSFLPKNFIGNFASGILGGWSSALIFYPIDTVRIFLSTSTTKSSKQSFTQLANNVKLQGRKFLYRGLSNLILSIAIFRGVFFGFFDTFKNLREQKQWKWLIAYSSGLLGGMAVYPFQTIRKRRIIMKQDIDIKMAYKNEGIRGFYRGISICPMQSLGGAALLMYFDKKQ